MDAGGILFWIGAWIGAIWLSTNQMDDPNNSPIAQEIYLFIFLCLVGGPVGIIIYIWMKMDDWRNKRIGKKNK